MNDLAKFPVGYQGVLDLVSERAGLVFPPNRFENVRAAIERGLTRAGTADIGCYCEVLRRDACAFDDLVAELTIGETYFLREPAPADVASVNDLIAPPQKGQRFLANQTMCIGNQANAHYYILIWKTPYLKHLQHLRSSLPIPTKFLHEGVKSRSVLQPQGAK